LETVIKDSNKLKAKKRLDSRKDHSGFFDHRPHFFFETRGPNRGRSDIPMALWVFRSIRPKFLLK
jgi:hypothetical protein